MESEGKKTQKKVSFEQESHSFGQEKSHKFWQENNHSFGQEKSTHLIRKLIDKEC